MARRRNPNGAERENNNNIVIDNQFITSHYQLRLMLCFCYFYQAQTELKGARLFSFNRAQEMC